MKSAEFGIVKSVDLGIVKSVELGIVKSVELEIVKSGPASCFISIFRLPGDAVLLMTLS